MTEAVVTFVAAALAALEIDTLLLGLPDRSFPSDADEDTGAGAPESDAGRRCLAWVRGLGFTGIQLAPQGETAADQASPYDGTAFSRGCIGFAAGRLTERAWAHLVDPALVGRLVASRPRGDPERIDHAWAHAVHGAALAAAHAAFARRRAAGDPTVAALAGRFDAFVAAAAPWLERDALYAALAAAGDGWREWPEPLDRALWDPPPGQAAACAARRDALVATHALAIERYAFAQFVLHAQHDAFRAHAHRLGLTLWGDLQVGMADRDQWAHRGVLLRDYRLGAPPSRTTPAGQPWGFPVLDPAQPAARESLVAARFHKMFAEYDGVRIDHPHGLVDPWVYRAGTGDDGAAVRGGARLFAAPDLPDHPALARFAIARRAQLNARAGTPRFADDWVVALEPEQVARYGKLVDGAVAAARRHGRSERALACEVLSTCPYPLTRVLARHGLGRFRVTQKADLHDTRDVYRSENAAPADWIMVGTHDTPPIWAVVDAWARRGALGARAEYLAARLAPAPPDAGPLARALAADPSRLVQAQFADLFASRARHVLVFFTDAFGTRVPYNRPGTVDAANWTLRLAADHARRFALRLRTDEALNLPLVLAMALRAHGGARGDRAALARRLEGEAAAWRSAGPPAG